MDGVVGLEIHARLPNAPALVADYLSGVAAATEFYAGTPADPAAFARQAENVARRLDAQRRARIAPAYRPASDAAAAKLERILAGDGFVVTTGQQTGLFGGPLYTIYKILTAIRLAAELEARLGAPVAPVFWVASDDHDWAEVDHADVVDGANELRRARLPDDGAPHPMSVRRLPAETDAVREEFIEWLPKTEFVEPIAALLRSAYRPGETMAGAFATLIAGLFARFDLVLVDPAHKTFKAAAAPVLRRELARAGEHARLLADRAGALVERGYHAQVTIAPDAANVLLDTAAGRDRLMRDGDAWLLRRSKARLGTAELYALLEAEPARFSPNVLLRPVVEAALLPTLAYVGGPAELSYFAQIEPLFDAHDVRPTLAFPRTTVVLVESKVRKVLDKYGLEPTDFAQPLHELTARLAREDLPEPVAAALAALRSNAEVQWDRLARAAADIDPTLRAWLEGQRKQQLAQVENAEKKIASHLKKRNEVALSQLEKAAVNLYPGGTPQERLLNPLPYLARYGPDLLDAVLDAVPAPLAAAPIETEA